MPDKLSGVQHKKALQEVPARLFCISNSIYRVD